jgi:hypothetical protein
MGAAIVAEQLHVTGTLIHDEAGQGRAIRERHARALQTCACARAKRPEECDQISTLGLRQIRERRHAGAGQSLANHRFEISVRPQGNARDDRRTELATTTFGSVTRSAAAGEHTSPRLDALRVSSGRTADDYQRDGNCNWDKTHETS